MEKLLKKFHNSEKSLKQQIQTLNQKNEEQTETMEILSLEIL